MHRVGRFRLRAEKDKIAVSNSDKSAVGTKWGNEFSYVNPGLANDLREREALHEPRGARICQELIVCPVKNHSRITQESDLQEPQLPRDVIHNVPRESAILVSGVQNMAESRYEKELHISNWSRSEVSGGYLPECLGSCD
jgi:hypothetical protein